MYDHELDSSRAKSKFKLAGKHLEARILQGIGRRAPQSWNRIAGLMPQKQRLASRILTGAVNHHRSTNRSQNGSQKRKGPPQVLPEEAHKVGDNLLSR